MKKYKERKSRIKLVSFLNISVIAIMFNVLFFPSFVKLKDTEQNMYRVYLDGETVGIVTDDSVVEGYLREARLVVANESENLVLLTPAVTCEGLAVTKGRPDTKEVVVNNMVEVLRAEEQEALQKSYTVKIGEYTVNLASSDEVLTLFQAAIDKYDQTGNYEVQLMMDGTRELNVLTTGLVYNEKTNQDEEDLETRLLGGFAKVEHEMFQNVEPLLEDKNFSDFELGFMDIGFLEDIEIVESYLPASQLTDVETAIEEVTKEQEVETIYEVVSGDTLSKIAYDNDLTIEGLIEINDTLKDENSVIRVGDELVITVPQPELSIVWSEQLYYEEDYEEAIQYVYNDDWYTTKSVTLQDPIAGHRKVVANISYINDDQESKEILKQEVTMEAVPKIVEIGTKIPPSFIKPISGGRLTSGFGSRTAPTKGASTYHKGIDLATPIGTSVVAACSGTVTFAGWSSGYGNLVIISHGDGRETRYGHLSKILVSSGQQVNQGTKIALSGNTGRSTGPHVHFEIRIDGTPVNPLKYIGL